VTAASRDQPEPITAQLSASNTDGC